MNPRRGPAWGYGWRGYRSIEVDFSQCGFLIELLIEDSGDEEEEDVNWFWAVEIKNRLTVEWRWAPLY